MFSAEMQVRDRALDLALGMAVKSPDKTGVVTVDHNEVVKVAEIFCAYIKDGTVPGDGTKKKKR